MIYKVKYTFRDEDSGTDDVKSFEIDDLVLFDNQPGEFRRVFNGIRQNGTADFDNATVILLDTGRVLVTLNNEK